MSTADVMREARKMADKKLTIQKRVLDRDGEHRKTVYGYPLCDVIKILEMHGYEVTSKQHGGLRWWVETVLKTFRDSEASGARSRDRQYAIEMLSKALEVTDPDRHE